MIIYADNENMYISKLGITSIDFDFKEDTVDVTFYTITPGVLIGKQGTTIDLISSLLKKTTHNLKYRVDKVHIKENWIWKNI